MYACKLCPFPWWAQDGPIRSLICVAWEYENDHRYPERNRIQNKICYLQFLAGRNCLVSSCRIPKKNNSNVSLHIPLNSDQVVRLRPNENEICQRILNSASNRDFQRLKSDRISFGITKNAIWKALRTMVCKHQRSFWPV